MLLVFLARVWIKEREWERKGERSYIKSVLCVCSGLPFLGMPVWLLIRRQFNDELTGLSMIEVVRSLW